MKKALKISLYSLGTLILLIGLGIGVFFIAKKIQAAKYTRMAGEAAKSITVDNLSFRDLNKNGTLDVYEDYRQDIESRVGDLLGQMTIEEKAGLLFIDMIVKGKNGKLLSTPIPSSLVSLVLPPTSVAVVGKKMNHFNIIRIENPIHQAEWQNRIQQLAERTRLGIPVTIASDPRHSVQRNIAIETTKGFSKWCEPIGLAATRDSLLTFQFGDIARQEIRRTLGSREGAANGVRQRFCESCFSQPGFVFEQKVPS